jgi:hypothetical protein
MIFKGLLIGKFASRQKTSPTAQTVALTTSPSRSLCNQVSQTSTFNHALLWSVRQQFNDLVYIYLDYHFSGENKNEDVIGNRQTLPLLKMPQKNHFKNY